MANPAMDTKNSLINSGANMANDLEQNIHKFSRETGAKTGEMVSQLKDSSAQYYKAGRDYLTANPSRSAAYAAVTGLVFGSVLTLMFRGRKIKSK